MKISALLVSSLTFVLVLGQISTVTLYAVSGEGFFWGGLTIHAEGVNADGATTYSFGQPQIAVRTRGGVTQTLTETWRGTVVQNAFSQVITAQPTNTDDLAALGTCSLGFTGGACVWGDWLSGSTTAHYTFTGNVLPYYTLIVTGVPTSPSTSTPTPTTALPIRTESSSSSSSPLVTPTRPNPTAGTTAAAAATKATDAADNTGSATSSSTGSVASDLSGNATHRGAIIGGVVAGVLICIGLAVLLLFIRSRRRRGQWEVDHSVSKNNTPGTNTLTFGHSVANPSFSGLTQTLSYGHVRRTGSSGPLMDIDGPPHDTSTVSGGSLSPYMLGTAPYAGHSSASSAPPAAVASSTTLSSASPPLQQPPKRTGVQSPGTGLPSQPQGQQDDIRPELNALRDEIQLLRALQQQQHQPYFDGPPPEYPAP